MFVSTTALSAQHLLRGQLTDEEGLPLAYASVALLQASDSLLLKGDFTDDQGKFELAIIAAGNYRLQFSQLGYSISYTDPIAITGPELVLPPFVLRSQAIDIDGVEVVAQKPFLEQHLDRTVINVENSVLAAGNSALEVLEKSPGIQVDRSQGVLSMYAKQGVVVLINGKRSRMEMAALINLLEGMSASNIEKIELITTPPANFDADGDAGIINIVLRNNPEDGFNGDLSLNVGMAQRPKYGAATNFNYRKGPLNLYGNLNSTYHLLQHLNRYSRQIIIDNQPVFINGSSNRPATRGMYQSQLGLDWELSPNTVLGVLAAGYINSWSLDAVTTTTTQIAGQTVVFENLAAQETNNWYHWMVNLSLRHTLPKGGILSLDTDYLHYIARNPADYLYIASDAGITTTSAFRSRKTTPITFQVMKLDYQWPERDKWQLEAGLKATRSQTVNDLEVANRQDDDWVADPFYTALFKQQETILAAYISGQWQLTTNTSLKIGLRNEYFKSHLGTEETPTVLAREYNRLFPSVFFEHQLPHEQRLGLSYSQRITRPSFNALTPALFFWGPNTVLTGNPALQRSITNTAQVEYRFKQFTTSVQYNLDELPIFWGQATLDETTNQLVQRAENMNRRQSIGLIMSFPLTLTPWWNIRNNISSYWMWQEPIYQGEIIRTRGNYWDINHTQAFDLPRDWQAEISGQYLPEFTYGFGRVPERLLINMGIQKQLPRELGRISFNFSDIFNTGSFWASRVDLPAFNLVNNWEYYWEGSIARLTYFRVLGRSSVKGPRQRQTGSETERARVGN